MKSSNLTEALYNDGLISSADAAAVSRIMTQTRKSEIYALSVSGLLKKPGVSALLAGRYALQPVSLEGRIIPHEVLRGVSADMLFRLSAVPFEYADSAHRAIRVAMADPTDISAIDDLSAYTSCRILPYVCSEDEINSAIGKAYNIDSEREATTDDSQAYRDDAIIKFVTDILSGAVRMRASDIHIEGMPDFMRIRYRIDGELYEKTRYPADMQPSVVTRIKIMGNMDIAEKRLPQDGKFSITVDGGEYDVRVSVMPTLFGEKCELRIAPKRLVFNNKSDLGLRENDIPKFERLFSAPHGLVLITGPTGSGKTTTLYSALSELNAVSTNIITIEDPVEITIPGINQIQLHKYGGLTFSSVLRSALRQDPNIIMIGEIRDAETAKVAVQASITGHLVLSTLHTNSAASAVNRLVNMGVERYLLADALVGVVSQRLVRKLCPVCRRKYIPGEEERRFLGIDGQTELYRTGTCKQCNDTGYSGRTSVYEIMEIDDNLRKIISGTDFKTEQVQKYATENGMQTLFESAVSLVKSGITSAEEIKKTVTV